MSVNKTIRLKDGEKKDLVFNITDEAGVPQSVPDGSATLKISRTRNGLALITKNITLPNGAPGDQQAVFPWDVDDNLIASVRETGDFFYDVKVTDSGGSFVDYINEGKFIIEEVIQ